MRGGGLLRLSRTPIETDISLDGLTKRWAFRGLAATADGSIWVATGQSLEPVFPAGNDGRTA
jgi:hypothetical protein